ncbi:MAG TPA: nucleotidyl transferase AbiEii/AbiGii toxin family protein [bacterium]|nr:nucleotidyl transferase AbiEii/AbiGii toxin family protein [bacterium]
MSQKGKKNIPASVRQKILNRARNDNRPFNELLQYYAMERFLYRLSKSSHSDRYILKGALMLRVWNAPQFRPTMDIDLLGKTDRDAAAIVAQIREIIAVDVTPDGLFFDPESIQTEQITEAAEYEGIRVRFQGNLDTARINMQIDIGFGDAIFPEPEKADLPTLLDFPAPTIMCYSRESAIAEKFEAMVKLGVLNSRMKDFYDIWLLSRQFDFNGKKLAEAIRKTFEKRGTDYAVDIVAFSLDFANDKQAQWTAFRKRLQQDSVPESFEIIVSAIKEFLKPIISSIAQETPDPTKWVASGPWDQDI